MSKTVYQHLPRGCQFNPKGWWIDTLSNHPRYPFGMSNTKYSAGTKQYKRRKHHLKFAFPKRYPTLGHQGWTFQEFTAPKDVCTEKQLGWMLGLRFKKHIETGTSKKPARIELGSVSGKLDLRWIWCIKCNKCLRSTNGWWVGEC